MKLDNIKGFLKRLPKALLSLKPYVAGVAIVAALSYCGLRLPELHNYYLRSTVGAKVYTIKAHLNGGGGTGFAVKAPSGRSYIVTNDHVCAITKGDTLLVIDNDGQALPRRILERSDFSDLCVLEGMPGVEGLSLGSEPSPGQIIGIIGHPKLQPLTMTRGEMVGKKDVQIIDHMMNPNDAEDRCDKAKNQIVTVDVPPIVSLLLGLPPQVNFCINVTKDAFITTVTIFPGSSGSPVVDFWGNVIGVAFASDQSNWARVVSTTDLYKMLLKY